jgi:hypothetical protein
MPPMNSGLAAVAMLLAVPAIAVASILAHFDRRERGDGWSTTFESLARTSFALRAVRMLRAHVCVLASFAGVLWVCQLSWLIDARDFVVGCSVLIAAALAVTLPWTTRRERRLLAHRAEYRRLLEDSRRMSET